MTPHAQRQKRYRERREKKRQAELARLQRFEALADEVTAAVVAAYNAGGSTAAHAVVARAWRQDPQAKAAQTISAQQCLSALAQWLAGR